MIKCTIIIPTLGSLRQESHRRLGSPVLQSELEAGLSVVLFQKQIEKKLLALD